jgi:hypothetical protein
MRPAICQTACGMRLVSVAAQDVYDGGQSDDIANYLEPWYTCENFQAVEDLSIAALNKYAAPFDPRFKSYAACHALDGVEVTVLPVKRWYDGTDAGYAGNNKWVVGITYCEGGSPTIDLAAYTPAMGFMTHEMAHAIQRCNPLGPVPTVGTDPSYDADSEPTHLNWGRYRINSAIAAVEGTAVDQMIRRDDLIDYTCRHDAGCVYAALDGGLP